MSDKTCGECKHYILKMTHCKKYDCFALDDDRCEDFEQKVITNGDKIRQGGDKRLITFATEWSCFHCAYRNGIESKCEKPKDKDCFDGMLAWLNAPAESEGEDE